MRLTDQMIEQPIKLVPDDVRPILCCPGCGGENIHIGEIQVEARQPDDDITIIEVDACNPKVEIIPTKQHQGISARRQSVSLFISCEGCWKYYRLAFQQHKGTTYVEATLEADRVPGWPEETETS